MSRLLSVWIAVAVLFVARSALADSKSAAPLRRVLDGLAARSIGPANMGGRVVDLAVVESDPKTYYIAAASGGVWKTTDGGDTFTPVFDDQPTLSIGAIALCQAKPEVIYVGTGESNPRNSVLAGAGVFRSSNGGKSWVHCGLVETHHIGRIVVHPTNPDIAYVAALGRLWGFNKERGLYKTTDGGRTWAMSNFIDENTGAIDVAMDPSEPDVLYSAAWPVRRDAFAGGSPAMQTGSSGAIFKSTDAGKTWAKLTGGLPERPYGRCGITICRKNPKIVFAIVQTDKTPTGSFGQTPKPGDDASTGGVFRSDDAGKSWKKLNDLVPRPFYYGKIRVDPTNDQRVYVLGVNFFASTDGGVNFALRQARGVHPDHHALWIDPKNPDHFILGNDGGLYVSKDRGQTFEAKRGLAIGQFYGIAVDGRTPYHAIGGMQDTGTWSGPVATPYPDGITQADWTRVAGADGFHCAVDPNDSFTVYAEGQFGGLMRVNMFGEYGPIPKSIRPPFPKSEPPYRCNWNAPFCLSPHDPKTLYFGAQHAFKSTDRGEGWTKISPDLTCAPKGVPMANFGHTISTLAESPVKAGVLWAGTDDGKVWVSRNDGKDWDDVGRAVASGSPFRWISKIEPSHFDAGTAFLSIDRHRNDDFKPYLFATTDFGATWKPIATGLPLGAVVGVIRQSSKNKNLLLAGTERGLYVSLDGGRHWHHLSKTGLPANVRIDDLVIHPHERELAIGTHGRSLWVMDISPLEQLTPEVLAADAHLFDVKPVTLVKERVRRGEPLKGFAATNPSRGVTVHFLTGEKAATDVSVTCHSKDGKMLGCYKGSGKPGLDRCCFDVHEPGEYTVALKAGDKVIATNKASVKAAE